MKLYSIIASLILTLFISPKASAADLVDLNLFPDWFKDAIKREKQIEKTTRLEIERFGLSSDILGEATLAEASDGFWYYLINIGSDSPVECYVFTTFDGAATSTYAIVEHSLTGVESLNNKSLTSKYNYAVDSGVIGDTPYILLDTLYNLGEGGEQVTGILKALSARTNDSLQICIHNEIGYRETFLSAFESFINAFIQSEANPEFFETVYQFTLNGLPVGYAREKYATDEDGDIKIISESAMVFPVDASSISRTDTVSTSWSRPDGTVINANEYTVENGTLASQFSIAKREGKWQVEGQMQGKAVQATLDYDGILVSGYGSYLETAKLRGSEQESSAFYMWTSDADPTAALTVNLSKIADNPNANFRLDMGPLAMTLMADDKGVVKQGTLEQGPVTMYMNLMQVSGEPLLP